jgi:hypothetical protein
MPRFRIEMINAEFQSREEGEYPSLEAATKAAVTSATRVASDSIINGEDTAAVEVRVVEGGKVVAHRVVNLSVSQLFGED